MGETFAILNAIVWACAIILFKQCGHKVGPFALNLFKNSFGLVLFLFTLPLAGADLWPTVPLEHPLRLILGGVVGIAIADTLFFEALNILGASRTAIIDCLYSPFVTFFAFFILSERLTPQAFVGASLIVAGVFLTSLDPSKKEKAHPKFKRGLLFGIISMALMAISIVVVKPLLNIYPVIWTTTLRLVGGTFGLLVVAPFLKNRREIFSAFKPQPIWKFMVPGSFLGVYLALLFWISGFKYTQANIAAVLNQTSALFTVILAAVFLSESLTRYKVVAIILAFMGSVLVIV